jgi:hypothetical protein
MLVAATRLAVIEDKTRNFQLEMESAWHQALVLAW